MTKKKLLFSQMIALKLHFEKMGRAQTILKNLNQERQELLNKIAEELGIKKKEFPEWRLMEDGTAFLKIVPKKKENDGGTKDKSGSSETKRNN